MSKQVAGFLAEDGTFFNAKPECDRYEHMKHLESLCETHGINFDNFKATLNAWHKQIRGYFDADEQCNTKWTKQDNTLNFEPQGTFDDYGDDGDDIPAFLPPERNPTNAPSGDKDAPGFLEQQIRKHK